MLAAAVAACATPTMSDAPRSLAEAEAAFAAHSVREDMRAAFLAAFAEDGVFVRDGWTLAGAYLRPRPAPNIVLDWRPHYVEVAASGDLGISIGPWKITSREKPDAAPTYGQFVSIWRRVPGSPWKVAVDLGIAHPEPTYWEEPLRTRQVPRTATGEERLAAAEADFQRLAARLGLAAAYEARGASDLRLYRGGITPVSGRDAAIARARLPQETLAWTVEASEVSRAGDFGYTRGAYAVASQPAKAVGYYLRAWRREASGWRILLDVVNPAPGQSPAAS